MVNLETTTDELLALIGQLSVEGRILRLKNADLQAQVAKLQAQVASLTPTPDP